MSCYSKHNKRMFNNLLHFNNIIFHVLPPLKLVFYCYTHTDTFLREVGGGAPLLPPWIHHAYTPHRPPYFLVRLALISPRPLVLRGGSRTSHGEQEVLGMIPLSSVSIDTSWRVSFVFVDTIHGVPKMGGSLNKLYSATLSLSVSLS